MMVDLEYQILRVITRTERVSFVYVQIQIFSIYKFKNINE